MSAETANRPKRLVVLLSGSGSNLQAILDACAAGLIAGTVVSVISNRPDVFGLERARRAGASAEVLDHKAFPDRTAFDHALMGVIDAHQPDLVILAGFMRILTPAFVQHYHGRLLNIHPSLLPAYKGTHTHQRALDDGASEHGASVHFVTAELDGGPVVMQARVPVLADDTTDTLAARVLTREHVIYPQVVAWFCQGQLALQADGIWLKGQRLEQAVSLA